MVELYGENNMKAYKVISEHKNNRKRMSESGQWDKPLYSSKVGFVQAIVQENGQLVTKHLPKTDIDE